MQPIPQDPDEWRDRLRLACKRSWKKNIAIAEDAGVSPETLSRILTGKMVRPSLDVVARLAYAAGTTVGWLLMEPDFHLSHDRRTRLRHTAGTIHEILRDT